MGWAPLMAGGKGPNGAPSAGQVGSHSRQLGWGCEWECQRVPPPGPPALGSQRVPWAFRRYPFVSEGPSQGLGITPPKSQGAPEPGWGRIGRGILEWVGGMVVEERGVWVGEGSEGVGGWGPGGRAGVSALFPKNDCRQVSKKKWGSHGTKKINCLSDISCTGPKKINSLSDTLCALSSFFGA